MLCCLTVEADAEAADGDVDASKVSHELRGGMPEKGGQFWSARVKLYVDDCVATSRVHNDTAQVRQMSLGASASTQRHMADGQLDGALTALAPERGALIMLVPARLLRASSSNLRVERGPAVRFPNDGIGGRCGNRSPIVRRRSLRDLTSIRFWSGDRGPLDWRIGP